MVDYDDDNVKEKIVIGTRLTALDLPDDITTTVWENEATILVKYANTLFSETHMYHNSSNVKRV